MRKYRNTPVEVDGVRFDSKFEAEHWFALKLRQMAGEISDLQRQVRVPLRAESGQVVCHVVPDFSYVENGQRVFCDAKGVMTENAKLKYKWFEIQEGVPIRLVKRRG